MAKKKTVKQRYENQYKTVEKRIKKLQKEGFIFDERKLPSKRKSATTEGLNYLKKFTEKYLKNMPSTKYKERSGKITTGARGEELQASERSRKGARTRQERQYERSRVFQRDMQRWLNLKRMEENAGEISTQEIKESELDRAITTGTSNIYYEVDEFGRVIDRETGLLVYNALPRYITDKEGSIIDTETGEVVYNPEDGDIAIGAFNDILDDFIRYGGEITSQRAESIRELLLDSKSNDSYALGRRLSGVGVDRMSQLISKLTYEDDDQSDASLVELGMLIRGTPFSQEEIIQYFGE